MSFAKFKTEDRRLVILRLLSEDASYSANCSIIQSALVMFGHKVSRDRVHTDLDWLAEQELITLEIFKSTRVAKLTQDGLDVSKGVKVVSGVKRPAP